MSASRIPTIDHDRLFKELLTTFFVEFLELFFPAILEYLDTDSITFIDKEVFTDVTVGQRHEVDLLVQANFQGQLASFLVHVENQSYSQVDFNKRMFRYFARLEEKFDLPVYPIVIFSYERPRRPERDYYQVRFPDRQILDFRFAVVQLNQLNWRDFLQQQNPVAAALMAKMNIAPKDRPKVKAQCLRLLVTLKLDPARMQLISGFIDSYLNLTESEETIFNQELDTIELKRTEKIMEITTSWMRKGQTSTILRILNRKLGILSPDLKEQIEDLDDDQREALTEDLLDFETVDDLIAWLNNH